VCVGGVSGVHVWAVVCCVLCVVLCCVVLCVVCVCTCVHVFTAVPNVCTRTGLIFLSLVSVCTYMRMHMHTRVCGACVCVYVCVGISSLTNRLVVGPMDTGLPIALSTIVSYEQG